MKATTVTIERQGAPDVMSLAETDLPAPGPGEARIEHRAIGLNYMDCYQRSGAYPLDLPSPLGIEAAGVVLDVGEGVRNVAKGDRVAYGGGPIGAYASARNIPAARLVRIPAEVPDDVAAAVIMKGMTVEYLLTRAYAVKAGDFVLWLAASGGVGQIAGQWGSHLGARMIGVAGGPEKCAAAKAAGYEFVIDRTSEDIAARVREITGDAGVPVVYDSVGKATFDASIASLAPRGYFMSFGATTGEAPAVAPSLLQKKGSLYFSRPTLATYIASREDLEHSAGEVFRLVAEGVLKPDIAQRYALSDIVKAHEDLEAARNVGSSVILP
jgi:NADPH2:quinone reductase